MRQRTQVEAGEGGRLGNGTVELVLALFDESFEVLKDFEIVFAWGKHGLGREELLL